MLHKLDAHRDWALLFLRLVIGAIFIYHGTMKWPMGDNMIFNILAVVEPLGGVAMIAGVLTRWAGLGLAIIMLGAIYNKMISFGQAPFDPIGTFGKWEFDLIILAGCVAIMCFGPGKVSADKALLKQ